MLFESFDYLQEIFLPTGPPPAIPCAFVYSSNFLISEGAIAGVIPIGEKNCPIEPLD